MESLQGLKSVEPFEPSFHSSLSAEIGNLSYLDHRGDDGRPVWSSYLVNSKLPINPAVDEGFGV